MNPALNWREIALLCEALTPQVRGLFVDRIIIPERPEFPGGYIKGEWAIRLTGKSSERTLLFSVRARHPYLALLSGKGPKASQVATHSAFDLSMSKHLKGLRVKTIEALPRERTAIVWFDHLGLVLNLIPAVPEALLVHPPGNLGSGWPILARSRTVKENGTYLLPDNSKAPENPPVRQELLRSDTLLHLLNEELQAEAFALRRIAAERAVRELLKQAKDRIRQSQTALKEGEAEPNWQRYGDLLKGSLLDPPPIEKGVRHVIDYETEESFSIPCDAKLSPQKQVEKFYQLARRKGRRISEAKDRIDRFTHKMHELESAFEQPLNDWHALERLERVSGIAHTPLLGDTKVKQKLSSWLGKSFISKDGLMILVGRSKDENLELTFKHARGNDLWMHIRGRPGAHVVIPIQPGKSAPLETLLDAATLAIYYSNGKHWGKTEVDYTFKKYVKRIKDSTEASYTNNKTLIIAPDPGRIKRLVGE